MKTPQVAALTGMTPLGLKQFEPSLEGWRVGDAGHTIFGPSKEGMAPEMVAQRIPTKAQAHLLAAAPMMLAELKEIYDLLFRLSHASSSPENPNGDPEFLEYRRSVLKKIKLAENRV